MEDDSTAIILYLIKRETNSITTLFVPWWLSVSSTTNENNKAVGVLSSFHQVRGSRVVEGEEEDIIRLKRHHV
ncbi:hypothetical protein L484_009793 [Morus notabilis]|uniref:Uncharacterized protein n=1 Tax=Morus notabilis TaxID=981085 RepID=W9SHB8_9ROSA|nr:hypothetical protein L484_009793 [Morus notabilis]